MKTPGMVLVFCESCRFFISLGMQKIFFTWICLLLASQGFGQESSNALQFWESLKKHCGYAYEGKLADDVVQKDFEGKKLVMHVRACDSNTIRIPFFVGEDKSRTWVLTYQHGVITLKHDHRHEDGSEDSVTQYGGTSTNSGFPGLQVFPADVETASRIPYASANVWWITLDESTYTYNLRRIGTDRLFTVIFDLTKPVPAPDAPWGWQE